MSALAGYAGLAGFAWLTLFQLMLAAGLPLGRLAWGGAHRVLPGGLRLASFGSAVVAALGAVAVSQAASLGPAILPATVLRPLLAALAVIFALSFVANLFGARGAERLHGVPAAALLAVSAGLLAWSPATA